MRSHAVALVAFLCLANVSLADVLTVGSGPQADFDEIADAVAVAVDGDTILVSPGDYAHFALDDRELQIVGTAGPQVKRVNGLVRIRNLALGRTLRISGLWFQGDRDEAIRIYDNQGQVYLQDCDVRGSQGRNILDVTHTDGYAGIVVENSTRVSLTDCEVRGGDGAPVDDWPNQWGTPTEGGTALWVESSAVAVHGCMLRGGRGGDDLDGPVGGAANGGHGGVVRAGASVWLQGSTVEGGAGGDVMYTFECYDAGNGGHGLYLSEMGGGATARRLDTYIFGGAGGTTCGDSYYDGSPGVNVLVRTGNTVIDVPGGAPQLAADGVSDQGPVPATVTGQPGAQVWLLVSRESGWRPWPRGIRLLGAPLLSLLGPTGIIPPGGVLTFPFPIPPGAAAGSWQGIQALVVEPGARTWTGVRWHFRE